MNKTLLFLTATMMLAFHSCKEIEPTDPDPTPSTSIVGTWQFDGLDVKNGSYSVDGITIATYNSTSSNEQGTVTFDEQGRMIMSVAYTSTYTFSIFGQTETSVEDVPMSTDTTSYVYDAQTNSLHMGEGEERVTLAVSGLATGMLKLVTRLSSTVEEDGQTITSTSDLEMRMSR